MKSYDITIKNLESNEVRTKTMELSEELLLSLDYKKARVFVGKNNTHKLKDLLVCCR